MIGEDSPPKSNDLEGWRQAIVDNRLRAFRLEAVAAAFQDLGQRDKNVQNALAKCLSDSVLRMLRRYVGLNHPNKGEDIILRVHGHIFEALLRPASADGRNLREAFVPRLLFRLKDAIAAEARERRIPDETRPSHKHKKLKQSDGVEGIEIAILQKSSEAAEDLDLSDAENTDSSGESAIREAENAESADELGPEDVEIAPQRKFRPRLFDDVRRVDEQITVNQILEQVPEPRKRLAFCLFMNGLPYYSKRKGVESIARALGISERTAREWVEEVRKLLEESEDIQHLRDGSRR